MMLDYDDDAQHVVPVSTSNVDHQYKSSAAVMKSAIGGGHEQRVF